MSIIFKLEGILAASPEDARAGYEIFLNKKGDITLSEINRILRASGHGEIADRSYKHYRRLIANGFRYYIPINHLDVYLSLGSDRIIGERRRFYREASKLNIEFSFDGDTWLNGWAIDISAVGFGILTQENVTGKSLDDVYIRREGFSDIPCILAWKRVEGFVTRFGVRAKGYISNYRDSTQQPTVQPRSYGKLVVTRSMEGEIDWQKFTGYLNKVNQFIIAIEDLIYSASDVTGQQIILAEPVLESIEFHSPGDAPLKVDLGAKEVAELLIDNIAYIRLERRKRIAITRTVEADSRKAEAEADKAEAEVVMYQLQALEKALEIKSILDSQHGDQLVDLVRSKLGEILGLENLPENFLTPGTPERAVFDRKVLPMAIDVTDEQDPEFQLRVDDEAVD